MSTDECETNLPALILMTLAVKHGGVAHGANSNARSILNRLAGMGIFRRLDAYTYRYEITEDGREAHKMLKARAARLFSSPAVTA